MFSEAFSPPPIFSPAPLFCLWNWGCTLSLSSLAERIWGSPFSMKCAQGFALRGDLHANGISSRWLQLRALGPGSPALVPAEDSCVAFMTACWSVHLKCFTFLPESPGSRRPRGSWTVLFTLLYISNFPVKCSLPWGWPLTSKVKSLCNSKQLNWYGDEKK